MPSKYKRKSRNGDFFSGLSSDESYHHLFYYKAFDNFIEENSALEDKHCSTDFVDKITDSIKRQAEQNIEELLEKEKNKRNELITENLARMKASEASIKGFHELDAVAISHIAILVGFFFAVLSVILSRIADSLGNEPIKAFLYNYGNIFLFFLVLIYSGLMIKVACKYHQELQKYGHQKKYLNYLIVQYERIVEEKIERFDSQTLHDSNALYKE